MQKLTFQEIRAIITSDIFEGKDHGPSQWMYQDVYSSAEEIEIEGDFKDEFVKLGQIKKAEHLGGEGKGDEYFTVYHFVDHDIYISFDGWYVSHSGAEFSEMIQVQPKIVEKTEWEAV